MLTTVNERRECMSHSNAYCVCVIAAGGAIYDYRRPDALGGATDLVHRYNTSTEMWDTVAPMTKCRAYFQVTTHNGRIFAVGGEDANRE